MATHLLENFVTYVEENRLVSREDKILLTVSGGVDSMVLLDLFAKSGYSIGVAHCNFCLRGEESDEDEVMVEQRAKEYGVEHFNICFDTTAEMERTGESMEMAARRLRYDWFDSLCRDHNYTTIAIAHHADDSIETFFINLFRGTGLKGLTGIKRQRGRVVRPLSFATRKEILEYATTNHIPYREDSSNRSTKYLRNKIRLGLVPRAREINPKFTQLMQSNISRLNDAQSFISHCVERIAESIISESEGIYTIHTDQIDERLPYHFVVYELLNSRFGFKGDVVDALLRSKELGGSGKRFYARDFVAYIDRGELLVAPIEVSDSCEVELLEGATRAYCGNSMLHLESIAIDLVDQFNLGSNIALIDADRLTFPLTLRRWREGDSFTPLGMGGQHKKVSDLLTDEKVSAPEKGRQFLLLSGEEIVWVIGRRINENYKITEESENILKITKEII